MLLPPANVQLSAEATRRIGCFCHRRPDEMGPAVPCSTPLPYQVIRTASMQRPADTGRSAKPAPGPRRNHDSRRHRLQVVTGGFAMNAEELGRWLREEHARAEELAERLRES